MVHISIKRGFDIPVQGEATGDVKTLGLPSKVALDVSEHIGLRLTLLAKMGDKVLLGQPIAQDKACEKRFFIAPAAGTIVDIVRGEKRRILYVVIETDLEQKPFEHTDTASGGIYSQLRSRPCDLFANPDKTPEAIFIKGLESAPLMPNPELELKGFEKEFESGLKHLAKLAPVHLVHRPDSVFASFSSVNCHTVIGPHPIANPSVHIAKLAPNKQVWTATVHDVICLGHLLNHKTAHTSMVVAIAGEAIKNPRFVRLNKGFPIKELEKDRHNVRLIAGDLLTGRKVTGDDYLTKPLLCAVFEAGEKREPFHFLRLSKFSFSRTYFTRKKTYSFTTNQHGEERPFVDGEIYDRVMPLNIPSMHLVKAILAEEYERAIELGLLEVAPEDFALSAFICPSKIDFVSIVRKGLQEYAAQQLVN